LTADERGLRRIKEQNNRKSQHHFEASTAIEILLDRARTGRLADELPAGVPKDLFSGKDFKYEKTKEGFILHCRDEGLGKNKLYQYEFKLGK
jgi:hypothetical protein